LKDRGNKLYSRKDYQRAVDWFVSPLVALVSAEVGPLVIRKQSKYLFEKMQSSTLTELHVSEDDHARYDR
jgi:hypothetical protein